MRTDVTSTLGRLTEPHPSTFTLSIDITFHDDHAASNTPTYTKCAGQQFLAFHLYIEVQLTKNT